MKTNATDDLQRQIELLVRAHLDRQRACALAAIERALTAAKSAGAAKASAPASRSSGGKCRTYRSTAEIRSLAERLVAAIEAAPGVGMTALAVKLDVRARDLEMPMAVLKREGRVRSVGARHRMRYFPMPTA